MISKSKDYKEIHSLKPGLWTSVHTLMTIGMAALVIVSIACFYMFSNSNNSNSLLTIAFLSIILIMAVAIVLWIKICMPFFMRKVEVDNHRKDKILSMLQEEYEYDNLAEKSRIAILEKQAMAAIDEKTRAMDLHRLQEKEEYEYNSKIAEITSDLFKTYCSAQTPHAVNEQQIIYQLIQLLTNNNK